MFMETAEDSSCQRRNVTIRKTFKVYFKYPIFQILAFFFRSIECIWSSIGWGIFNNPTNVCLIIDVLYQRKNTYFGQECHRQVLFEIICYKDIKYSVRSCVSMLRPHQLQIGQSMSYGLSADSSQSLEKSCGLSGTSLLETLRGRCGIPLGSVVGFSAS